MSSWRCPATSPPSNFRKLGQELFLHVLGVNPGFLFLPGAAGSRLLHRHGIHPGLIDLVDEYIPQLTHKLHELWFPRVKSQGPHFGEVHTKASAGPKGESCLGRQWPVKRLGPQVCAEGQGADSGGRAAEACIPNRALACSPFLPLPSMQDLVFSTLLTLVWNTLRHLPCLCTLQSGGEASRTCWDLATPSLLKALLAVPPLATLRQQIPLGAPRLMCILCSKSGGSNREGKPG